MARTVIHSRTNPRTRLTHLRARVSSNQKALIERAAELVGLTVPDFIASNLQQAALKTIEESERIRLTTEESRSFAEALLQPRRANSTLREAARKYLKNRGA